MQIKGLHKNIYKLARYARTQESLAPHRKRYEEPVHRWRLLRGQKVSNPVIQKIVGLSRSTLYRYQKRLNDLNRGMAPPSRRPRHVRKPQWTQEQTSLILKIRRDHPTYGKAKIAVILRRDHAQTLSESTVGRILCHLKHKGLVQRSPSALRVKKKRRFTKGHAQAWTFKKYETMQIGERLQIDHMTVTRNGLSFKHFQAWDRRSKFIHAKSSSAKRFLLDLVQKIPFPILSIQVDGGSEFRAEFEQACADLHIPLIVLPPRKPQYNGGVERGNRTLREEFYNRNTFTADTLSTIRTQLHQALLVYNSYRPHQHLKGLTPFQYLLNHQLYEDPSKVSHLA